MNIDFEAALDLLERGEKVPVIANELGISPPTLRARIAEIQNKQGLLLQYRSLQSLQLTELQARVLEAITPEKINEASLKDLILSYKILKDKESVIEGKPSEIKGLIAHLIYLEKQEEALKSGATLPNDLINAEYDDSENPENDSNSGEPDMITSISQLDQQEF